jgi:MOSC domain-containing protein YiiM
MSHIVSIAYQPRDQRYTDRLGDYIRMPFDEATLLADHGIDGDQKAGHNKTRQVNLLSVEWLAARAAEGYRAAPGQFGEQLIVAGLAVEALPPGTLLAFGPQAILSITKGRTGCDRLAAAQGQSIAGLGPIGALARVVMGGPIRVGDEVRVLEPAAERVAP